MSKTEHQEPLVSEYKPQFYTELPDDGYVSEMDSGDHEHSKYEIQVLLGKIYRIHGKR